jgi:transcriptional regulator with XRE-family HTH domain
MGTRETRRQRGRRRGDQLIRRLVSELRAARMASGVSQRALARELGWSQSEVVRFEQFLYPAASIARLSEAASALGLELSAGLSPRGDGIRDQGQQRAIERFLGEVAHEYRRTREVLLPLPGDRRSWDLLLRLDDLLIGVEVETRIRDIQALVRRIRERERDGGVDEILVVLSDTAHNRRFVDALRAALGQRYSTSPRFILAALRAGRPVPGSGVLLI